MSTENVKMNKVMTRSMTARGYNVALFGICGAGKGSWIRKLNDQAWDPKYHQSDSMVEKTTISYGDKKFNLYDMNGQMRYSYKPSKVIEALNIDVCILFYDRYSKLSRKYIKQIVPTLTVPFMIVQAKCDIPEQRAKPFTREIEMSSKRNINVHMPLDQIILHC